MTAPKSTASPRGQEGGVLPVPPSTPTSEPAMCGEAVTGSEQNLDPRIDPHAALVAALRLAGRWDAVSRRLESDDLAQDKVAEVYGRCADALLNTVGPYLLSQMRGESR